MIKLNEKDCAFGRHETFQLRFSWLPKGYQEFCKDNDVFESSEATVRLGVGKNMVSSIKHWMKATQLLSEKNELSELARYIFDEDRGVDPYLEDEATIWLLHWLLCTNPKQATTWFWFFNRYIAADFDTESMQSALDDFIREELKIKAPSSATLKNDCSVLTRMYSVSDDFFKAGLDDVLDSPMALLELINKHGSKRFSAELAERNDLSLGIFGFAVAQCVNSYIEDSDRGTIPMKTLIYSQGDSAAVASVFRMTETDFMTKLEKLQSQFPELFEIRETAGISQLYLSQGVKRIEPMTFLQAHYQGELVA
ncbi:DUF4007 family protein [Vibrio rhizosphaerae]|uniref:DUF4007 family protein n=1 Tax=Vibrio rhizosphaerae TaxID=398736 RepID=A0ABU4IVC1_9VIBR|nr:DUF4007 family protein [Vibrio rhizosphaerae]MDW6092163.1 DUF4007 family protein [Vibrio rhizosphaerae]